MHKFLLWAFFGLVILLLGKSCGDSPELLPEIDYNQLSGEELANIFCDSCHVFADPELLPRSSWENVLPVMGHFMGIREPGTDPYAGKGLQEGMYLEVAGVFPDTTSLSDSSWHRLQEYILSAAPDSLEIPTHSDLIENQLFEERIVSPDLGGFPAVCMLDYDEYNDRLYVGDVNGYVTELDQAFATTNFTKLMNPVVKSIRRHEVDELLMLDIGFLDPKDLPAGAVVMTDISSFSKRALIFEELTRPVDFLMEDLNGDGLDDIVVCGFGNLVGSLTLHQNTGNGFQKFVLCDQPGAIKVEGIDLDNDGDQDLVCLFGQGDEGVRFYYNNDGHFREEKILSLPPSYGTTDFSLKDIDGDEDLDLIIANGDNGNYSRILKPYHGIRIYLNNGEMVFDESFFYPMHGAYKLEVEDFNQDGDEDIFACAFYPDFKQGLQNSLVYLENDGLLGFTPSGFNLAPGGRWMVMASGDMDHDGDIDLVVGSYALGPGDVPDEIKLQWQRSSNHLLFLENTLK